MQNIFLGIILEMSHRIRKYNLSFYENCVLCVISEIISAKAKVNAIYVKKYIEKDLVPALRHLFPNGDGIYV